MASDQLDLWGEEVAGGPVAWSLSRGKRLRACLRKYYLHHYASRGGNQPEADPETRELYLLRNLTSRYMWVGEVVHDAIEQVLLAWRQGRKVTADSTVERATRRMRADFARSARHAYRARPGKTLGLAEHEYDEPISRDEWRAQHERMERCLRSFFALDLTVTLQRLAAPCWLAVESFGTFAFEGASIIVKPDLVYRESTGRVVLVDWKTGRARLDEERLQLGIYGLYVRRNLGISSSPLGGMLVHLDAAEVVAIEIGEADLGAAEDAIRVSLAEMRALQGTGPDLPARDKFPMTDDLAACRSCVFRRACGRE